MCYVGLGFRGLGFRVWGLGFRCIFRVELDSEPCSKQGPPSAFEDMLELLQGSGIALTKHPEIFAPSKT